MSSRKFGLNLVVVLAIADGSVTVDGREIYTAEGLRVGVFTSTEILNRACLSVRLGA